MASSSPDCGRVHLLVGQMEGVGTTDAVGQRVAGEGSPIAVDSWGDGQEGGQRHVPCQ